MSTQDTFISHLVELRDRLLRAILAVIAVFLCLFYWAKDLYALLAKPPLAALPAGGQMIATDVVGVFLVPVKVAFLVAFVIAAIFTPPDVISQVMLAVPLWFLYELGILLARFVGRSSGAAEEGAAAGTGLDKGLDSSKAGQK